VAVQVRGIVPGGKSDLRDEPHLEGRRITVRDVQAQIEGRGLDPAEYADRHGLGIGQVYAALAYYHTRASEVAKAERQERERIETATERGATSLTDLRTEHRGE